MNRWIKVAGMFLGMAMATACAHQDRCPGHDGGEPCSTPGEKRCASNTRTQECGEDGFWGEEMTFICPEPAECQVEDDVFHCK